MSKRFAVAAITGLACLGLFVAPAPAQVSGFKLEVAKTDLPAGLPEAVKKQVSPEAVKLAGANGKALVEVWWCAAVAVPKLPVTNGDLQALMGVPEGALLGVMRLSKAVLDYKGSGVKEGVYTLRYLTQPIDGNHLGTYKFNDFAVLLYPKNDPGTPAGNRDDLIKVALTQAQHPFVVALEVPKPDVKTLPALDKGEENHLVIFSRFAVKASDQTGEARVGILPGIKLP